MKFYSSNIHVMQSVIKHLCLLMFIKTLICIEMSKQKVKRSLEAEWMKLNFSHCFGNRCVTMF